MELFENEQQWFEILDDIRHAKGKEKQLVLEAHKENETLLKVLNFLLNPRIVTGISKKKFDKIDMSRSAVSLSKNKNINIGIVIDYLINNNTGKDIDVKFVKTRYCVSESELEKEMLRGLIIKDLPLGISANTVNKIVPNFIPIFKLQKGNLWDGSELEKDVIVSLKLDGNSATVFNLEDETYMLSRSGATMTGFDHILKYYRNNLPLGYVYCGELVAKNYDKLEHGPLFQYSNGITNSKHKEDEKSILQHVVFDMVDYEAFKTGTWSVTFKSRKKLIIDTIEKEYDPYSDTFNTVEHITYYYEGKDLDKINEKANKVISEGLEGLMLNEMSAPYKIGPQKWLLKVKEFKTADVEVIGLKEHIRGNKVGSIIVDWKGHEVSVGGLKDELRDLWWKNPNEIVGKIVEIEYFRETTDKNGKLSVRFPSFERIREDKLEVSIDE